MTKVAVYRKEHFNAAHRLHSASLSDAENAAVFGKCNYPNYHGHNYELIVKVTGDIDPKKGYVVDLKMLGDLIKREIVERFDHRNLNLDVAEFKNVNPTAENIAVVIHGILRNRLDSKYDLKITLYETERNYVEFPC